MLSRFDCKNNQFKNYFKCLKNYLKQVIAVQNHLDIHLLKKYI